MIQDSAEAVAEMSGRVGAASVRAPELAPALASVVLALVCTGSGGLAFLSVLDQRGPTGTGPAALIAIAMVVIQLGYFARPGARLRPVPTTVALLAQGVLVFVPVVVNGVRWDGFPGFLVGSLLLACPSILSIPLSVIVVAGVGTLQFALGGPAEPLYAVGHMVITSSITGLSIFGLGRLSGLVVVLHRAQGELGRMAVAQERLRFARDTHDVLGMSLSAISLKSELGHRLITEDPDRARSEIGEVLVMTQRALTEVRMIASGRSTLTLSEELDTAERILGAAGIEVTITDESRPEWSEGVSGLFATAVREGVTNILRHTRADLVTVHVEHRPDATACLVVANDDPEGADEDDENEAGSPLGGQGLRNLTHRTEELGGRLTAERTGQGRRFVLRLEVPSPDGVTVPGSGRC